MRLRLLIVLALLIASACSNGGSSDDGESTSTDTHPACEFARDLPARTTGTPDEPKQLTRETVAEVSADAPSEVREDVRVLLESARVLQEKVKELSEMPPDEQRAAAQELATLQRDPAYLQALGRYTEYLREHCPSLARQLPTPGPSPDAG